MESLAEAVAAQVRAEMGRHKLKQKDVGAALGITQQAVSPKWNGQRLFTVADLLVIADLADISLAELLGPLASEVHPHIPEPTLGGASARRTGMGSDGNSRRYLSPVRSLPSPFVPPFTPVYPGTKAA